MPVHKTVNTVKLSHKLSDGVCVTTQLSTSEVISFVDTEILMILWSLIQFLNSASGSGHFAMY
jgi:hypothetical protein